MTPAIAIVGMACRYPDARSPLELWENVLAQRQAFRRLPPERLCLDDYLSADRSAPDCTYAGEAALIEGYEFDRVGFRVAGSTFRIAGLSHWLALDVAAQALVDAGFPEGADLPRDTTGVLLGNTLTGEFVCANLMRLRWPYVRRVVAAALGEQGWTGAQRRAFLEGLEMQYKAPFPPVGEESLAGGLSNTIAGRICNYFDLKGGGYTVDGACAASLLAVTTAGAALVTGDLDVALAGGVDISMDPFELVGFAKAGALAPETMRVYDARSAGFWPGEGCGFGVLMRHADAMAQGRRIYAVIRGWGISSDGSGGMTRPEARGQLLALQRAYRRAGFGIETVTYFEGHGTGTSVGDTTELHALSRACRDVDPTAPPAAIGSVKANIGHTKAAAGVAGLLKAAMALHRQLVPPTTGCEQPHPELTGATPALQILPQGALWPADRPLRAGVSAMGFGGINTHVVLESSAAHKRQILHTRERELLTSAQDAELVLLSVPDTKAMRQQVEHLVRFAARLSRAEVTDLAACLANALDANQIRAAVVASTPDELAGHLETLRTGLDDGVRTRLETHIFLGTPTTAPRLGFLFPGQGAPMHCRGGAWYRRFPWVQELYVQAHWPINGETVSTAVAQPAIVTASIAARRTLNRLGVSARVAIGHSLGELTALHWGGALDEAALLRIATVRGQAMVELGHPPGAMASLSAGPHEVEAFLSGDTVVIAGLNAPRQTVIAGEATAVAGVVAHARARGLRAVSLPVSHAFHSPLVAAAVPVLEQHLYRERCQALQGTVVSTVTGAPLAPDIDVRDLLCRQVTAPVRFTEALAVADEAIDLWLEVGPGQVLSGLLAACVATPVVAMDAGGPSLRGVLRSVGTAFVLGTPVDHTALFAGRFVRPFDLAWQPRFFVNPCELARETGVRLALLGRSRPTADAELAANLARTMAAGVTFQYIPADVTDAAAVRTAIHEVEKTLGPVTAILHGAGANVPQLLRTLDAASMHRTLSPKVDGVKNLLAVVTPDRLRLCVVFGSLIARTGMRGEADYAVANEWLTRLLERFQVEHPACRCLALEWSVWSRIGMGERLGRVDALLREGITPMPPDVGIAILRRLLAQPLPTVSVVVTGRFGEPPTLQVERPELPLLRFLEQPQVYYPGVELITDAELSIDNDPYLNDHIFQGERLLPAVIGLEAMAQVAMAVVGARMPPVFEAVQFTRPVVVPAAASLTVRVVALVHAPDRVEVALRSAETAWQVDHFRATCRFGLSVDDTRQAAVVCPQVSAAVALDPARDLYGGLLFHTGHFQRLRAYRRLQATACLAEIVPEDTASWFGPYLPATLVLGDPGARDDIMHAIV